MRILKAGVMLVSVIICAALGAPFAIAAPSQSSTGLQAAAATKTVYVLSSVSVDPSETSPRTAKIVYNASGLVKRVETKWAGAKTPAKTCFTYGKKNGITSVSASMTGSKWTYKLDGKGRQVACTNKDGEDGWTTDSKVTYKNGKVASVSTRGYSNPKEKGKYRKSMNYSYKGGRLNKMWYVSYPEYPYYYSYDKRGNLLKRREVGGSDAKYTNSYNSNGLLVRRVEDDTDYVNKYRYKYKAVRIKSGMVAKVKQQQWALINENLNFALGVGFSAYELY